MDFITINNQKQNEDSLNLTKSVEYKIINSFDIYYVKWINSFDDKIFSLLYDLKNYDRNKKLQYNLSEKQEKEIENLYGTRYKSYFEKNLARFCYLNNINFDDCLKIEIKKNKSKIDTFKFIQTINYGSSGVIFRYLMDDKNYTLKIPFKGEEDTSKTESTIHYILFHLQKSVSKKIVPDIEMILMTKNNFYYIMMEKLEFELYYFFEKYGPLTKINRLGDNKFKILEFNDNSSKWNFFLELLYQISDKLILLQDTFKFMHNDLKCNNILVKVKYPDDNQNGVINVDYLFCDFGGSSCDFQNISYVGTVLCSDSKFNTKKDLFMLLHMYLAFSPKREQIIKFIDRNQIFNLTKNLISSKDNVWKKLYTYSQDGNTIDESFDPRNLKIKLEKMINNSKNFN